jgi:hypothetical protein
MMENDAAWTEGGESGKAIEDMTGPELDKAIAREFKAIRDITNRDMGDATDRNIY